MADIHIEEFYKDVAIALVQLYGAFPRRVNLFVEDIAGPDEPDEFGLHSRRHMACFGALLWLAEEGLLRYVDTIRQEALDQAVLTQAAFIRLSTPAPETLVSEVAPQALASAAKAPPSVRADYSSHIHLFREALRSGSSDRITQVVQTTFFVPPEA
ncbi:MAG: hypothetical protein R3280_00065 [Marinobacter sp.]|uniref:hypothetical protein n=1 Tax=Marinobacter sp. TaxID=50741 RepID=UPI00299E4E75|nr:hypothetical protein [Marinobacter sp.]MDX1633006.1 hypothetical protein [Marinobacter sp.]